MVFTKGGFTPPPFFFYQGLVQFLFFSGTFVIKITNKILNITYCKKGGDGGCHILGWGNFIAFRSL